MNNYYRLSNKASKTYHLHFLASICLLPSRTEHYKQTEDDGKKVFQFFLIPPKATQKKCVYAMAKLAKKMYEQERGKNFQLYQKQLKTLVAVKIIIIIHWAHNIMRDERGNFSFLYCACVNHTKKNSFHLFRRRQKILSFLLLYLPPSLACSHAKMTVYLLRSCLVAMFLPCVR